MTIRRITNILGKVLVATGILILLFVAYQLWGTDLITSHDQAVLHQKFENELHKEERQHPKVHKTTASTTKAATLKPAPTIAPPAEGQPVGTIDIPAIGVSKTIVEGTATSDLQMGPGHYLGTPLPGEAGNVAIAGHRTTYGAPFYNLDGLKSGDPIIIQTLQGSFTYTVFNTLVVSPTDVAVTDSTTVPELTLTTCNPRFSASQRLVVQAKLTTSDLLTLPSTSWSKPTTPPTSHSHHADSAQTATGLAGSQGDWVPALLWGLAVTAVGLVTWLIARRRHPARQRRLFYVVGMVGMLGVLFYFFAAVSPLLPASF